MLRFHSARNLAGFLLLSHGAVALQGPSPDYTALTNPFDEVTNFNVETVRGMAFDSTGDLWAINTHGSTLVRFDSAFADVSSTFHTLNNPVAMGIFGDQGVDYLVVGGGGTHAVAVHEPFVGTVQALVRTPSEVGDLVIDHERGEAFVSCPGANVVLQLGLPDLNVIRSIEIPAIRPRFLSLDEGTDDGGLDNRVYVAPFLSGNNSVVGLGGTAGAGRIVDASDPAIASQGLPDEDLFSIDPSSGVVKVELTGAGTLLTAHGKNFNGEYWMLSLDANNKDPQLDSEPALNGKASFNRLRIFSPQSGGGFALTSDVDLDDSSPPNQVYQSSYSASFPFALEFHSSKDGVIASSTGDKLIVVDGGGSRVASQPLMPGSIPRDLLFDDEEDYLFVYLWGTNQISVFSIRSEARSRRSPSGWIPRRVDPTRTGDLVRRGSLPSRALVLQQLPPGRRNRQYSVEPREPAARPQGHSDDPVVAQHRGHLSLSLAWRAFSRAVQQGLPGTPRRTGGARPDEFSDFQDFVFSLQAPANPLQSEDRILDAALTSGPYPDLRVPTNPPVAGDALQGQQLFDNFPSFFGAASCVDCHISESGGLGDMLAERGSVIPEEIQLDVAHLRQLKNKEMPSTPVVFQTPQGPVQVDRPLTGFAVTHDGASLDVHEFLSGAAFTIDGAQTAHITAFVRQFDQGIAPLAHAAISMRFDNVFTAYPEVGNLLVPQAQNAWIDLAVRGRVTTTAGIQDMGWVYNTTSRPSIRPMPMRSSSRGRT